MAYLADNNVIAIFLPSHTSVITLPNDNGINQQLHEDMADVTKEWRQENGGLGMQKGDTNSVIAKAWETPYAESV